MSESTPSFQHDLNLLFGILALQIDLIDERQFVEACTMWAARKDATLADVLAERGWLSPDDRAEVERLVKRKLERFKDDPRSGLASLVRPSVVQAIQQVPDEPIRQSLVDLVATTPSDHVPVMTSPYEVEHRDRYQIQRLHARGGIGQVWLARDGGLGREIALKELRPDRREGSAYVARFIREAQITGQLEHPSIVPVYELVRRDQQAGGPFYVMRFIKGRTLKQASTAFHEDRPGGARGLAFRALIQPMVDVCNAIAYAHSRGVIHRDLKGSNVVVGDFGEVTVVDWGLARLVGQDEPDLDTPAAVAVDPDNQFTQPGQVIGTPAYMAPEQAAGRLDLLEPRTDVYGLGAILYEILTGRPPFTGEDQAEVLRLVSEGSPAPPRRHWPQAPPALEAVCLKALAREPADRYASATEMAQDLQSWLADEPVTVYPEPLPARMNRWARRHQSLVSSAVVLLLAGVVALGVGVTLIGQEKSRTQAALDQAKTNLTLAEEEGGRAAANAVEATAARHRAEGNLRQARAAVDQLLVRVSEDETLLANEPRMEQLRRQLLQDALRFYLAFVKQEADDAEVRRDLILTYRRIARVQQDLAAYDEAEKACLAAARLCSEMLQASPDDPLVARELAGITNTLGNVYRLTGKLERSRDALLEALRSRQALEERHEGQAEFVEEVATTLFNLAQVFRELGELPDAEEAGAAPPSGSPAWPTGPTPPPPCPAPRCAA
jgi:serine/threonine protein kinase